MRWAIAAILLLLGLQMSTRLRAQWIEPAAPERWITRVDGIGETVESARQVARLKVIAKLDDILRTTSPPLLSGDLNEAARTRLQSYLDRYLLEGPGYAASDVKVDQQTFKAWTLELKKEPDWGGLFRQELTHSRTERSQARQGVAHRAFLALLAVLLAGMGYLRADQVTQYRYSWWLRGAAVAASIAASIAAATGVWWL